MDNIIKLVLCLKKCIRIRTPDVLFETQPAETKVRIEKTKVRIVFSKVLTVFTKVLTVLRQIPEWKFLRWVHGLHYRHGTEFEEENKCGEEQPDKGKTFDIVRRNWYLCGY